MRGELEREICESCVVDKELSLSLIALATGICKTSGSRAVDVLEDETHSSTHSSIRWFGVELLSTSYVKVDNECEEWFEGGVLNYGAWIFGDWRTNFGNKGSAVDREAHSQRNPG